MFLDSSLLGSCDGQADAALRGTGEAHGHFAEAAGNKQLGTDPELPAVGVSAATAVQDAGAACGTPGGQELDCSRYRVLIPACTTSVGRAGPLPA